MLLKLSQKEDLVKDAEKDILKCTLIITLQRKCNVHSDSRADTSSIHPLILNLYKSSNARSILQHISLLFKAVSSQARS